MQQDVYHYEGPCTSNTSCTVDYNRPRLHGICHQRVLALVHILQEPQNTTRVTGHTMVWPCLEVEVVDIPSSLMLMLIRTGMVEEIIPIRHALISLS